MKANWSCAGPGVFLGYAGQHDLYHASLTPDGFFRTGDLAKIDEQGYVHITGRLKDLIIRGGVNISPIPIEDTLARHSAIESVSVIGFPDERLGERICAVIQPRKRKPSLKELLSFCHEQGLAKRHYPELVRFVGEMPRTAGGKIRKADLRDWIAGNVEDVRVYVNMKQRINDIDIAYSESGKGQKVVMLHGLAEDRYSFADVRQRLRGVHTFACDLRGHGETQSW